MGGTSFGLDALKKPVSRYLALQGFMLEYFADERAFKEKRNNPKGSFVLDGSEVEFDVKHRMIPADGYSFNIKKAGDSKGETFWTQDEELYHRFTDAIRAVIETTQMFPGPGASAVGPASTAHAAGGGGGRSTNDAQSSVFSPEGPPMYHQQGSTSNGARRIDVGSIETRSRGMSTASTVSTASKGPKINIRQTGSGSHLRGTPASVRSTNTTSSDPGELLTPAPAAPVAQRIRVSGSGSSAGTPPGRAGTKSLAPAQRRSVVASPHDASSTPGSTASTPRGSSVSVRVSAAPAARRSLVVTPGDAASPTNRTTRANTSSGPRITVSVKK